MAEHLQFARMKSLFNLGYAYLKKNEFEPVVRGILQRIVEPELINRIT
jgi:hypothetical protein